MRMKQKVAPSLDQGLLRLFKQALAKRRWATAEHLLRALEEQAKSEPACEAAVEHAYLCFAQCAPEQRR